ncbi:hypothetical protein AVEN_246682-1 [Araneus ventricosus]|uniref:CCHC-type domain-containing protein n=1 Tax=Araneus ventricosus TaxID=182803 RepID=A0A4Y2NAF3_ARAVE|nr:hypothetical protein AVEN_246682-1 [Araneus ventricosus]
MPKGCSDLIPERTVDPEVFADMDNFDLVNNPTAFAKSLRLQFPKFSKGFSSSDFEEFVQEHVGVENLKSLGRLNFPNEWQMEVESKDVREKLIRWGKTKIKNRSCWISPLCTSEIRGFVHWLPNSVTNQKVKDLLSDYGEVLFVENQKQSLWSGKVASDSRYYALYLRAGKAKEDLPHFTKIENFNVLVTVRGRNPACFHCRESGHRKNECKKFKEKLNSYCQRPSKSAPKRRKPRGKRFAANIKESKDAAKVPETPIDKGEVASSGAKQKTTERQVSADKKEKKTPANSEVLVAAEELDHFQLKMTELLSETMDKFKKELTKNHVPVEDAAPAATGEVEKKKKKKKKKNKKKTEANPSES